MPKIIENLQQRLVSEARKQIVELGYGAMTIRSVAEGCGVGVGTVYNYFSSKDHLVAAFMLEDWEKCISAINAVSEHSDAPLPVLKSIFEQIGSYARMHETLFSDKAAASAFSGVFSVYHALLRSQLAQPLLKFCSDSFSAEFIAEALLTWTLAGKDFDAIYPIIEKLF